MGNKMAPAAVVVTAADVLDGFGVAEFSGTEEVMVGFVEGEAPLDPPMEGGRKGGRWDRRDRVDEGSEVGIGGVQMSRHAGNEERAGVVLACGYRGIISYRIGIKEKRFADRDGFGDIDTAGSSLFGTTHAGMIAAHVNSKTKEEEEEKRNALYDISATGGGKMGHCNN